MMSWTRAETSKIAREPMTSGTRFRREAKHPAALKDVRARLADFLGYNLTGGAPSL